MVYKYERYVIHTYYIIIKIKVYKNNEITTRMGVNLTHFHFDTTILKRFSIF